MRRRTFDILFTAGGVAVTVLLVVAGAFLLWGHDFANSNVSSQLSQQEIVFPTAAELAHPDGHEVTAQMQKTLGQYAGKPLTTGAEAKAYADHFIGVHLSLMPYHGVYSQVSNAARANPNNAALQSEVQTVFQGTTLRGLLLEAYAFSEFGQIALIAAVISFILAGAMAVLSGLGIWHLRRVDPAQEFLAPHSSAATPA